MFFSILILILFLVLYFIWIIESILSNNNKNNYWFSSQVRFFSPKEIVNLLLNIYFVSSQSSMSNPIHLMNNYFYYSNSNSNQYPDTNNSNSNYDNSNSNSNSNTLNHQVSPDKNQTNSISEWNVVSVKYYFFYRYDVFKQWMSEDVINRLSKTENGHLFEACKILQIEYADFPKKIPNLLDITKIKYHYDNTYYVSDVYFKFETETIILENLISIWKEEKKMEFYKDLNDPLCEKVSYPFSKNYNFDTKDRYLNTPVPLDYIRCYSIDEVFCLHVIDGVKFYNQRYFTIYGISIDTVSINNISYKFVCIHYTNWNDKRYIDVLINLSSKDLITSHILMEYVNSKRSIACLDELSTWRVIEESFYTMIFLEKNKYFFNKYKTGCPHVHFFGTEIEYDDDPLQFDLYRKEFDVPDGFGGIKKEIIHFNAYTIPEDIFFKLKKQANQEDFPILNYKLNLINSINDTIFNLDNPWLKENLLSYWREFQKKDFYSSMNNPLMEEDITNVQCGGIYNKHKMRSFLKNVPVSLEDFEIIFWNRSLVISIYDSIKKGFSREMVYHLVTVKKVEINNNFYNIGLIYYKTYRYDSYPERYELDVLIPRSLEFLPKLELREHLQQFCTQKSVFSEICLNFGIFSHEIFGYDFVRFKNPKFKGLNAFEYYLGPSFQNQMSSVFDESSRYDNSDNDD